MATIVVVDAWKNCEEADLIRFPFLANETKFFGQYINSCLNNLRDRYNIVHCADARPIMDEIDLKNDFVIDRITDMPVEGPYLFCGFHLGRCIDRKLKELDKSAKIIVNLSLLFPADRYEKIDKTLNYCYYTHKEIVDVQL